jgi:hypothetical protein
MNPMTTNPLGTTPDITPATVFLIVSDTSGVPIFARVFRTHAAALAVLNSDKYRLVSIIEVTVEG